MKTRPWPKEVDALKQEFTKAAGRSLELARKYVTGIETKEVAELADVKAARDKAFQALLAKAAPVLQRRVVDRQKAVDELQKTLDAPKKAVADAQDRVKKAADAKAKAEEQKGLDKAKKELADATADLAKKLEQPKKDLTRVQNEKKEVDQAKDDETRLAAELAALAQGMDRSRKDMTSVGQELETAALPTPILRAGQEAGQGRIRLRSADRGRAGRAGQAGVDPGAGQGPSGRRPPGVQRGAAAWPATSTTACARRGPTPATRRPCRTRRPRSPPT